MLRLSARRFTGVIATRSLRAIVPRTARSFGVMSTRVTKHTFSSRMLHTTNAIREETITVVMPPAGESISEGEIGVIEKEIGDYVELDEPVMHVETDKTAIPVNAPTAGTVTSFLVEEGDTVSIGQDLFTMTPGGDAPEAPAAAAPADTPKEEPAAPSASASTPTAAAAPKEEAKAAPAPTPKPAAPKPAKVAGDDGTTSGGITKVKMTRMRLRTAERLKEAQNTAAMLTTFNEIDMSNIMAFRSRHKEPMLKKHGVKLGFMSAFCKASAAGIMDMPIIGAAIDEKEIVYHDYVNIAIAVATPKGLVVPVVRNVEQMSFIDIERNIAELGAKAKEGNMPLEDFDGGTFTISNGGVFGSLMGTPIINPPQSAILGMHGIFQRPVAIDGKVEIRPMMYVALTYDHRLIDGREAVTFLRKIKQGVEDPATLILE